MIFRVIVTLLASMALAISLTGCTSRWIVRVQNQTGSDLLVAFDNGSSTSIWQLDAWDGGVVLDLPDPLVGNMRIVDPVTCDVIASGAVLDESTSINVVTEAASLRLEINRKRNLASEERHLPETSLCLTPASGSK